MKYDFVAIGDITTDAFIRLEDAEELMDHGTRQLCVRFADKVPYEEVIEVRAVGNAANAAVSAARIGLSSALIARIGDDENGQHCRDTLKKNGVSDEYVETQAGLPTNYHYVLWFGAERTILVKQTKFTYSMPNFDQPPKYIYLTSLGESAEEFHHEVAAYVREHPETKLVFQPGTFQIKLGAEGLKDVYAVTDIFFCNKEEAQKILSSRGGSASGGNTTESDVKKLMEELRKLGPKIVVVTDGPNGSNILDDNGAWHVPMYPDPAPPVSRTGAGDATASTTVSFISLGLPAGEALLRGVINAASVVQGVGAQTKLLTHEEIEAWYAKRPADFKATQL
jgi:ribokinase